MAEKSIIVLLKKKEDLAMKVTTRISGYAKEGFLNDCVNKDNLESHVAKNILEIYYQILPKVPNHKFMDFAEIKKFIIENIKFKWRYTENF